MRNIVADVMTSFQSDFENHDRPYIESTAAKFSMLWVVGQSHTWLARLGEYETDFNENVATRYEYSQSGLECYTAYIDYKHSDDKIFLITDNDVREISEYFAKEVIRDICIPVIEKWKALHGPLPKAKVKVKIHNISLSELKMLIQECREHGDDSLLECLKRFHSYRQLAESHIIDVYWQGKRGIKEFSFYETIDGRNNLGGAIVFHGWPETGYQENFAMQLSPSYGWSTHT